MRGSARVHATKVALLFGIILFFLPISVSAFSFVLENHTDTKISYTLLWHDHGLPQARPASIAAGEIPVGESRTIQKEYSAGSWEVAVRDYEYKWRSYRLLDLSETKPGDIVTIRMIKPVFISITGIRDEPVTKEEAAK